MKTFILIVKRTFQAYARHNCSLLAAAISYYVLFSVVPLTIFLASIFGFVMRNETTRQELVDRIVAATPLEQEKGANLVRDTITGVSRVSAPLTVLGLVGVAWSASAMFGSLRRSLDVVWGVERGRPFLQQKLVDLAMMAGLGMVLLLSVVGTGFLRTLRETSTGWLGPLSANAGWFWETVSYLLPAVFSFALFSALYRFVPRASVRFRDVWPAALLATVLFEALKNSFAFYVANFNNFNLAYGALGGILLFLLWTYLSVNIVLLGAEVAARLAELRAGVLEGVEGPGRPLRQEALEFLKGLVVRQEPGAGAPEPRRKP